MARDAQSKVVVALIRLGQQQLAQQQQQQQDGRPAGQVALVLSPLELSAHAGLDVDTFKRIVVKLRDRGYVRIQDERVVRPDLDYLRDGLLGVKDQFRGPTRERGQG